MKKDSRVQFAIEAEIDEAFERLAAKMEKSKSGFMRELIIRELRSYDLLPEELMARLLASA